MSIAAPTVPILAGPAASGMMLSPDEFDSADWERGWRYELLRGVVVVSPAPSPQERGPNDLLGYLLNDYQRRHDQGSSLDATLPEHDIHIDDDRRRADRVIWAGLGRKPRVDETPTVAVEFVSAGRRNWLRDYEVKRAEYESVGIQEYWVVNRFDRTLTVFKAGQSAQVVDDSGTYCPVFLPGFELNVAVLLAACESLDES